jgi:murein DD-endopeptidase MepM/ murein hydrolase activator NlpD
MKIIIVNQKHSETKSITLGGWTRAFLSVCLIGIPTFVGAWGYSWLISGNDLHAQNVNAQTWLQDIASSEADRIDEKQQSEAQIAALANKIAELQARLIRLDALGEKLTQTANLDQGEFDFSSQPAIGGPAHFEPDAQYEAPDLDIAIQHLSEKVNSREQQLSVIDSLLSARSLLEDIFVAGRPVATGRITSGFGYRTDPFTERKAFHGGIDFGVREGTEVLSVAAGVVNWAGRHHEYGNLVEIKHGDGLVTRYAHNKSLLVKNGDVIKKGQVIALSGSTGRSSGPHVHFEIYKNGRVVDPAVYVHRTNR